MYICSLSFRATSLYVYSAFSFWRRSPGNFMVLINKLSLSIYDSYLKYFRWIPRVSNWMAVDVSHLICKDLKQKTIEISSFLKLSVKVNVYWCDSVLIVGSELRVAQQACRNCYYFDLSTSRKFSREHGSCHSADNLSLIVVLWASMLSSLSLFSTKSHALQFRIEVRKVNFNQPSVTFPVWMYSCEMTIVLRLSLQSSNKACVMCLCCDTNSLLLSFCNQTLLVHSNELIAQ